MLGIEIILKRQLKSIVTLPNLADVIFCCTAGLFIL